MAERDGAGRAPQETRADQPLAAEGQAVDLRHDFDALSRAHADLQALMAESDFGALFLDSKLCITRFTDRAAELFGLSPSDVGHPIANFAHRLRYDDLIKDAQAVLSDGGPLRREIRSKADHWYDMRLRPYRTAEGIDGVVISTRDIGERKSWQARQELLLKELTHRVKNILTVVQAIAGQTMRSTTSAQEFVETFRGRLAALASTHDLLVQSDWAGADLAELASNQVKPYQSLRDERIAISGPSVRLPSDMVAPFGLVLHELSAKSARYGALSVPEGRVDLTWTLSAAPEGQLLSLTWREHRGPAGDEMGALSARGTLLERAIPNATVRTELTGDGPLCTIEVTIPAATHK